MRTPTFIALCIAICYGPAQSTVIPGGAISGSWTKAGSPYNVYDNVEIPASSTLRIEPGVRVVFMGHYTMKVTGALFAIGTITDSIVFTVNDTTGFGDPASKSGGWEGMRVEAIATVPWDSSCLKYCRIEYGKANNGSFEDNGGGIYYAGLHSLGLESCMFYNNFAAGDGGGICCDNVILSINNCMFINNRAENLGGGMRLTVGIINVQNTVICNNTARQGGGIFTDLSAPNIINCTICNNMACPTASGATFIQGGGLCLRGCDLDSLNPFIANCIIYGNRATGAGAEGDQIYFNDVYGNTMVILLGIYYCDIEGGQAAIAGKPYAGVYSHNLDSMPQFVSPSNSAGNDPFAMSASWRCKPGSPCINRGATIQNFTFLPYDIAGTPRFVGRIDLGAYEYSPNTMVRPVILAATARGTITTGGLQVFDLLGRAVVRTGRLLDGRDLTGAANGVYIRRQYDSKADILLRK
jgi:predicted outer membrane repeat protein